MTISTGTTIHLASPVVVDSKTYSELKLRTPRLGDVEAVAICTSEVAALTLLASRLAGVGLEVIRHLEMKDSNALMAAIAADLAKFNN